MNIEEIELSPIEATAYWWVNSIKNKVRDIVINGARTENEITFVDIFYKFYEVDWRILYIELIKYITLDVENYVPKNRLDSFSQNTEINGHNKLNNEISKIVGKQIPNICLASNDVKDSVVYTTTSYASVWYKSCGVNKLPTRYAPTYILTGDKNSLDFYNLLISTIAIIDKEDKNFQSVSTLRERFCNEYMKLNKTKKNINEVIEMFNYSFDNACKKGIILGRSFKEIYFTSFQEIDYVTLDSYTDLAKHYASIVLHKSKNNDELSLKKQ